MIYPQNTDSNLLEDPKFIDWVAHPNSELDRYWHTWLETHPDRREELESARSFLQAIHFPKATPTTIDKSALLQKIHQQQSPQKTFRLPFWSWSAAAAFALLIAAWWWVNWTPNSYSVPYGAMEKIELPDGSQVTLNANSTLRLQAGWSAEKTRQVWLEGEAFFEVNSKPLVGAPTFVVHTSQGDIKVLGTTFNVRDRKKDFSVVLTEGSVVLALAEDEQGKEREVSMEPGEFIKVNLKDHSIDKTRINTDLYTAWTQGKLAFENTPISYLASVIEEQYGYEVKIADPALLDRKLTGTLKNPSLEDLIQVMAVAFDIQITKTDDRILTIDY